MRSLILVVGVLAAAGAARAETPGPEALNNEAVSAFQQGRHDEAEKLYRESLAAWKAKGAEAGSGFWRTKGNLAALYSAQGRFSEAEPLYLGLIADLEHRGVDARDLATALNNTAEMYRSQARLDDANTFAERAVATADSVLASEDPRRAAYLATLGAVRQSQGRLDDAARLLQQCRSILRKAEPRSPRLAAVLNNLAVIASERHKFADAESVAREALGIWEKTLGPEHPRTAIGLNNVAQALRLQNRLDDAEPLYLRAAEILTSAQGVNAADAARVLGNLGELYYAQGRHTRAVDTYRRAIKLLESAVGGGKHPDLAMLTSRLAEVRRAQGHYSDAERLYRRSLAIAPNPELIQAYRSMRKEAAQAILSVE